MARSKGPTRLEALQAEAREAGLLVCTWSPGYGATRYRFFVRAKLAQCQDYFGPASGVYTALGLAEARTYLAGVRAGRDLATNEREGE